jgi:hypothetical protein
MRQTCRPSHSAPHQTGGSMSRAQHLVGNGCHLMASSFLQNVPGKPTFEHFHQLWQAKRFGKVIVHTSGEATFAIARDGIGRERHNGKVLLAGCFACADGLCRFDAIHDRHLHVHEHKIERRARKRGKCLAAIVSDGYFVSEFFQETAGKELVHPIVFSQQDEG